MAENNEILRAMKELPDDWWQTGVAATSLIEWFSRHILPLVLVGSVSGEIQYSVYSGTLLLHQDILIWLTAGHVVEEIVEALSHPEFNLDKLMWVDNYGEELSKMVPLHRADIPMISWRSKGLDIGFVIPSLLDTGNLLQNDKVRPVEAQIWKNLESASPEGYYAIGYPRENTHFSREPVSRDLVRSFVEFTPVAIPIRLVGPPSDFSHDTKWTDKGAIYGAILPYLDYPEYEVDNVRGMSGGPILSVERNHEGRIVYRLVGINDSWARAQGIIRGEPISRVVSKIDDWLSKNSETK